MKKIFKNKKMLWAFLIIFLIIFIFIISFFTNKNFLTSKDGWNSYEREINSKKVLISGNGNEPGWFFKILGENLENKVNSYGIEVSLDYGETNWVGIVSKSQLEEKYGNFQFRGNINKILQNNISTTTENTKNIIIFFEKKECIDDGDIKYELSVNLNFNAEKEYRGCANFLK